MLSFGVALVGVALAAHAARALYTECPEAEIKKIMDGAQFSEMLENCECEDGTDVSITNTVVVNHRPVPKVVERCEARASASASASAGRRRRRRRKRQPNFGGDAGADFGAGADGNAGAGTPTVNADGSTTIKIGDITVTVHADCHVTAVDASGKAVDTAAFSAQAQICKDAKAAQTGGSTGGNTDGNTDGGSIDDAFANLPGFKVGADGTATFEVDGKKISVSADCEVTVTDADGNEVSDTNGESATYKTLCEMHQTGGGGPPGGPPGGDFDFNFDFDPDEFNPDDFAFNENNIAGLDTACDAELKAYEEAGDAVEKKYRELAKLRNERLDDNDKLFADFEDILNGGPGGPGGNGGGGGGLDLDFCQLIRQAATAQNVAAADVKCEFTAGKIDAKIPVVGLTGVLLTLRGSLLAGAPKFGLACTENAEKCEKVSDSAIKFDGKEIKINAEGELSGEGVPAGFELPEFDFDLSGGGGAGTGFPDLGNLPGTGGSGSTGGSGGNPGTGGGSGTTDPCAFFTANAPSDADVRCEVTATGLVAEVPLIKGVVFVKTEGKLSSPDELRTKLVCKDTTRCEQETDKKVLVDGKTIELTADGDIKAPEFPDLEHDHDSAGPPNGGGFEIPDDFKPGGDGTGHEGAGHDGTGFNGRRKRDNDAMIASLKAEIKALEMTHHEKQHEFDECQDRLFVVASAGFGGDLDAATLEKLEKIAQRQQQQLEEQFEKLHKRALVDADLFAANSVKLRKLQQICSKEGTTCSADQLEALAAAREAAQAEAEKAQATASEQLKVNSKNFRIGFKAASTEEKRKSELAKARTTFKAKFRELIEKMETGLKDVCKFALDDSSKAICKSTFKTIRALMADAMDQDPANLALDTECQELKEKLACKQAAEAFIGAQVVAGELAKGDLGMCTRVKVEDGFIVVAGCGNVDASVELLKEDQERKRDASGSVEATYEKNGFTLAASTTAAKAEQERMMADAAASGSASLAMLALLAAVAAALL